MEDEHSSDPQGFAVTAWDLEALLPCSRGHTGNGKIVDSTDVKIFQWHIGLKQQSQPYGKEVSGIMNPKAGTWS